MNKTATKNYYQVLGVEENASSEEIKRSFRQAALKFHPDRNKEEGAEQKFKEANEAYETLSDPEKRAAYDHQQRFPGVGGFGGFGGFPFTGGVTINVNDIFSSFFQGHATNESAHARVDLTLEEVYYGTKKTISYTRRAVGKQEQLSFEIQIPAEIEQNSTLRVRGQGHADDSRIPAGDLIVHINVVQHAVFHRQGFDLYVKKSISIADACLGTSIEVISIDGDSVSITIPAGTESGSQFRVPNKGLQISGQRGSMIIVVSVEIPKHLTKKQKKILEALRKALSDHRISQ
jgi:molecular chaperone DnaJ